MRWVAVADGEYTDDERAAMQDAVDWMVDQQWSVMDEDKRAKYERMAKRLQELEDGAWRRRAEIEAIRRAGRQQVERDGSGDAGIDRAGAAEV